MDQNTDIKGSIEALKAIASEIQASVALATYQEEEDEDSYKELIDEFESRLMDIHVDVANHFPLQLEAFEREFIDPDLEGLLLPRLLGFSVLRGYHDKAYKYLTPQDHFKNLLIAITGSPNFEFIKNRIGQTVQIGFALSSDIWITNLLEGIENKRVHQWLLSQKLDKFYDPEVRKIAYVKYRNQFSSHNYFTAKIPTNMGELKLFYPSLKHFLFQRQRLRLDNSNIKPAITTMLLNPIFSDTEEQHQILFILLNFFNLTGDDRESVKKLFNKLRKENKDSSDEYFDFLIEMYENRTILGPDSDKRVKDFLDTSIKDNILTYYELVDQLHSKGFMHVDVIEAIKNYLNNYKGLSNEAEAIRQAVLRYFRQWIDNADVKDYPDYFELFKTFTIYMDLFGNEHFNQQLEYSSLAYIRRLLKHYTDKRGKDYQDIKKICPAHLYRSGLLKR
ncbi:MAG: hypothetical protein UZ08_BCD001000571 [Candidatus Parvibacillus calidus]|nr:MAG: hypothetical protein UZ08_BCD001000571 [Candidatus Parvibacillus calidus]